jgi:hypothetical protein
MLSSCFLELFILRNVSPNNIKQTSTHVSLRYTNEFKNRVENGPENDDVLHTTHLVIVCQQSVHHPVEEPGLLHVTLQINRVRHGHHHSPTDWILLITGCIRYEWQVYQLLNHFLLLRFLTCQSQCCCLVTFYILQPPPSLLLLITMQGRWLQISQV